MQPHGHNPMKGSDPRLERIAAIHRAHASALESRVKQRAHAAPRTIEDACSHAWLQLIAHPDVDLLQPRRALAWLAQTRRARPGTWSADVGAMSSSTPRRFDSAFTHGPLRAPTSSRRGAIASDSSPRSPSGRDDFCCRTSTPTPVRAGLGGAARQGRGAGVAWSATPARGLIRRTSCRARSAAAITRCASWRCADRAIAATTPATWISSRGWNPITGRRRRTPSRTSGSPGRFGGSAVRAAERAEAVENGGEEGYDGPNGGCAEEA
jgi:hypothetical protein